MRPRSILSLKGRRFWQHIFANGKRYYKHGVLIVAARIPELHREDCCIYAGIAVRKANNRKAVIRNRVKRLVRVTLSAAITELPFHDCENPEMNNAMVIVWSEPVAHRSLLTLHYVQNKIEPVLRDVFALHVPIGNRV